MDPFHLHGRFHTNPCVLRYAKTLLFLKDYGFIRQTVLYQSLLKQLINNLTDCDFTCLANVLPGRGYIGPCLETKRGPYVWFGFIGHG